MNSGELTSKNLEIAKKFAENAKGIVEGILLSGSNAWGANYAVNENSDIDLLVIVEDIEKIGMILDKYVSIGLVDSFQKERFEKFRELVEQGKANTLSFRVSYQSTWVGIDFYIKELAENICEFKDIEEVELDGVNLRVVKEFRSNPPKKGGYSVDELGGNKRLIYHPNFQKIDKFGFVSKTLIDGSSKDSYFLGVIAFFFAIEPVILYDNRNLSGLLVTFLKNIKSKISNKEITHVTREERMNRETRERIIHNLNSHIVQ